MVAGGHGLPLKKHRDAERGRSVSQPTSPDREMTDADLDGFMDASAVILGLRLEPAWRDAVRANLAVTFRLGGMVRHFELPDEAEPAPVFTA